MADDFLSVEEAADIAGVSVATIRRWSADGNIDAHKIGRQWVVHADSLRGATSRSRPSRPSATTRLDFEIALRQLARRDANELWVPDILHYEDFLHARDQMVQEATARVENLGPFDRPVEVELPKNAFFTRASSLLSFPDRLAYHACVLALAGLIDARRPGGVYSCHFSTDPKWLMKHPRPRFASWQNDTLESIRSGNRWVVATDITAFFDNIQLKLLFEEIDALGADPRVVQALKRMLNEWSLHRGVGIPQGPDASRLLGNFYLYSVDRALERQPVEYFRYMDDIRITASSRRNAMLGLRELERITRARGLTLSAQKTQLLVGDEAERAAKDGALTAAGYLFETKQDSAARKNLVKIYKEALRKEAGGVAVRAARFALWRLRGLRDSAVLGHTLRKLEDLGPIASIVAPYLTPWLGRSSVQKGIASFLFDEERNIGHFMSVWLLATMLECPGRAPADWISYARVIARDRNEASFHRAVAANVVVLGRDMEDRRWLEDELRREFDPTIIRGYLVALARIGRLTKGTIEMVTRRSPETALTTDYLHGRSTLPSLIYRDRVLPMRRDAA